MKESEKDIRQKILDEYCQSKRGSIVEQIQEKLGDDATIKLLDDFSGRLLYLPNKSSLRRAALPMLIRRDLQGLEPGSDKFKARVKNMSDFYKLTQKAVIKINKKGIFLR